MRYAASSTPVALATNCVNGIHRSAPYFCFWLFATILRIANYIGFTISSGNTDAEFLLLGALRKHTGELWTVAFEHPAGIWKRKMR